MTQDIVTNGLKPGANRPWFIWFFFPWRQPISPKKRWFTLSSLSQRDTVRNTDFISISIIGFTPNPHRLSLRTHGRWRLQRKKTQRAKSPETRSWLAAVSQASLKKLNLVFDQLRPFLFFANGSWAYRLNEFPFAEVIHILCLYCLVKERFYCHQ